MYHCHILEHEDQGMMGVLDVIWGHGWRTGACLRADQRVDDRWAARSLARQHGGDQPSDSRVSSVVIRAYGPIWSTGRRSRITGAYTTPAAARAACSSRAKSSSESTGGRIGDISIFGLEGYAGQHHISEMMGGCGWSFTAP